MADGVVVAMTVVTVVPADVNLVVVFSVVVVPLVVVVTEVNSSGKQANTFTLSMVRSSPASSSATGTSLTAVAVVWLGSTAFTTPSVLLNTCKGR